MAKKVVTLYIDDTNIRLLVASGQRIKKLAELPLELGLTQVSAAVKEAEIAARVKRLFRSQKVRAKKVIVGLSGLHCLTRPLVLPQLPQAMLDEAVMREARRVLPVPVEQLYISWQVIPGPEEQIHVFLVAIPRRIADALITVLHQMGLKPYLMDLKPLALARVVPQATAVIVDVQPAEFDIVIMSEGIPQPVRTISLPSTEIPRNDRLLMVKNEIDRTIKFYDSNNPEKPLAADVPVFVSGELADEPELCQALSNELERPVLPLSSPLGWPDRLDPTHYMVNIGLALKELDEHSPSVVNANALPVPYRAKPIPWAKLSVLPGTVIVIGLLIMLTVLMRSTSASNDKIRLQLDADNLLIKQKQQLKEDLTKSIDNLEKQLAGAKATRDTFTTARQSIEDDGDLIDGDLMATVANLFQSVVLSRINHTGKSLNIQGSAPSEVEILSYARNLKASGRFAKVLVSSIRLGQSGDSMDFTLILETGGQE
ncbi:MAG: pilus assembly protein PilM [Chloroflexota bacterium]